MNKLLLVFLLFLPTTTSAEEYDLHFKRTEKNLIVSGEFKELKWFLIRWQDTHWNCNGDHGKHWTKNKHVLRLMDCWLDEAKRDGYIIFDTQTKLNVKVLEEVLSDRYGKNVI